MVNHDFETVRNLILNNDKKSKSSGSQSSNSGDNALYKHWLIPYGVDSSCTIRLVPDADETNVMYWRDYSVRRLPFLSVKGMDIGDTVAYVTVPAFTHTPMEQLNVPENCAFTNKEDPIQVHTAEEKWWQNKNPLMNTYKRKISHVYSCFVRRHPGFLDEKTQKPLEDTKPNRLLRRLIISDQIHIQLKSIFNKKDIKYFMSDFEKGHEFEIIKERGDGKYANYHSSQWAFTSSPLNEQEINDIQTNGLYNLSDYIPKKPTEEQLQAIYEMFEASIAGLPYDPDKWSKYYKPSNVLLPDTNSNTSVSQNVNNDETEDETSKSSSPINSLLDKIKRNTGNPVQESSNEPKEVQQEVKSSTSSANKVLEMLKAKRAQG